MSDRYWQGNRYIKVSELFDDLSDEEIENLRNDFLNRSTYKINDLYEKYHLNKAIFDNGVLRKNLPPIRSEQTCPYCNEAMYYNVPSRSERYFPKPETCFCVKCGHKRIINNYRDTVSDKECKCQNCLNSLEKEKIRKRGVVYSIYGYQHEYLKLSDLNEKNRVDLLWLFDYSDYKDFHSFSFNLINGKNDKYVLDIVRELHRSRVLSVSPYSDLDAFVWKENNEALSFYLDLVDYDINVDYESDELLLIKNQEYFKENPIDNKLLLLMLKEIVLKDILFQFSNYIDEINVEYVEKLDVIREIKTILEKISYTQILSLCYKITRDIAYKIETKKWSRSNAADLALQQLPGYYKRSCENGWEFSHSPYPKYSKELLSFLNIFQLDVSILRKPLNTDTFDNDDCNGTEKHNED